MDNGQAKQAIGAVMAIAAAERQFREVMELIDHGLDAAKKFKVLIPLAAAGWVYLVSDEERYAMLSAGANQLLDKLAPLEGLFAS
jgi:hypothetical protein